MNYYKITVFSGVFLLLSFYIEAHMPGAQIGLYAATNPSLSAGSVVYVHDHHEQKPDPFTLQWLYGVAAKNPHFMHYKEVRENRKYFIKLLRSHIQDLENKLADKQWRISFNKFLRGMFGTTIGGVFIYHGGYSLFLDAVGDCRDGIASGVSFIGSIVLGAAGAVAGFIGCKTIVRAFQYKRCVQERLNRDRNILQKLENIGESVA